MTRAFSHDEREAKRAERSVAGQRWTGPDHDHHHEHDPRQGHKIDHEYGSGPTPCPLPLLTTARHVGATGGEALAPDDRTHFESAFGNDLGGVRVHVDDEAAERADALRARAFTIGTDVYLGRGERATGTPAARRLLAHELTHVLQQRTGLGVQRQEIPDELRSTPNYWALSNDQLQARHDWILEVLGQFDVSTPDTSLLENQISDVGTELARRTALAQGRTFADEEVAKVRAYFTENAKTGRDSCIVCLNKGMKLVTGRPQLPTTPKTIEKSMAKVAAAGMVGQARELAMLGASGQVTRGGARPARMRDSVWDGVIAMSGGDPGWSVFTMSLMDGEHSVTLTLDASVPGQPHMYWSDQWTSKGGWKEYTRATLDDEVVRLIQGWWDGQAEGLKHKTVVRLWRLRSSPATP